MALKARDTKRRKYISRQSKLTVHDAPSMNVSLRRTDCLKKHFRWYFPFILPLHNAFSVYNASLLFLKRHLLTESEFASSFSPSAI